jgi:DNA-binding transcriptional regulator YdaS (Cro superfamily)
MRLKPTKAAAQRRALSAVAKAKREGLLKDLPDSITRCTDCPAFATEYDHRDYGKPLEVEPVCHRCNWKRWKAKWPRKPVVKRNTHPLLRYLNGLTSAEQKAFALRCGTTIGYLRKAVCIGQRIREAVVIAIERESGGAVKCEALRPDVDWAYVRNSRKPKRKERPHAP